MTRERYQGEGRPGEARPGPAARREAVRGAPLAEPALVDAVALIVGIVVGAGIFRTPSLVAANATGPARRAAAVGPGRARLPHRGHVLRGAGQHLAPRRRRLPLPAPGARRLVGLPVRLGAADGHPHRLHRAAGLRLRRLRLAAAAAGRALLRPLRGALGGGAHRAQRGRRPRWARGRRTCSRWRRCAGWGSSSSPGSSSRRPPLRPGAPRRRRRAAGMPPGAWRWCSCC